MSVKIKNIKKSFSSGVVLNGIDITLEDDTIYCLMGPSGIGKTTLLRIITGLEKTVLRKTACLSGWTQ